MSKYIELRKELLVLIDYNTKEIHNAGRDNNIQLFDFYHGRTLVLYDVLKLLDSIFL